MVFVLMSMSMMMIEDLISGVEKKEEKEEKEREKGLNLLSSIFPLDLFLSLNICRSLLVAEVETTEMKRKEMKVEGEKLKTMIQEMKMKEREEDVVFDLHFRFLLRLDHNKDQ